jgi:hypothetical protein
MVAKRFDGLEIERAADEVLALKPGATEAYALNQTAAIVFDLCDGEHSKLEMASEIQHRTGLPADEQVVELALNGLAEAGLVALDESTAQPGITRRSLVRRLSLSAATLALLPVIQPIMMKPAAAAISPHPLVKTIGGVAARAQSPGFSGGPPPGRGGGGGGGGGRPPGNIPGPPPGRGGD